MIHPCNESSKECSDNLRRIGDMSSSQNDSQNRILERILPMAVQSTPLFYFFSDFLRWRCDESSEGGRRTLELASFSRETRTTFLWMSDVVLATWTDGVMNNLQWEIQLKLFQLHIRNFWKEPYTPHHTPFEYEYDLP
jgi:hypothetical protein